MRLVDKYILRSFLGPLLYCLFTFISIYVIIDLFGHLDEIVREHLSLGVLLTYYLSYIPYISVQIMPIAMLIATMFTLNSFLRHNELNALRASGISLWNILKPFLMTGFIVSALVLIINDSFAPKSIRVSLKIREEKLEGMKYKHTGAKTIKDVALYGSGNKIIYARSYNPGKKVIKDIIIHEHDRKQHIVSKTTAKKARWENNKWIGFDITSYKLDAEGQIKEEPSFLQKGKLDIKETPQEIQSQKCNIEVFTIYELWAYIKRLSGTSGPLIQNLLIEAHNRISYPFANVIVVLIGAAFCLRTRQGGRFLGIGLGLFVGLLFYGTIAISIALGKGGVLPPIISAWAPNIIFGALSTHLINKY